MFRQRNFATAYQVCLPSLVTATELMAGNARLQGGASVAAISGRGLAGVAVQAAGAVAAFWGNAASFGVSAVCLLRIRPASPAPERSASGARAVGLLMAAGGAGGLLGALAAPRLTRVCGTARALLMTSTITGLSGLLIPLTERGFRLACYLTGRC